MINQADVRRDEFLANPKIPDKGMVLIFCKL